MKWYGEIGFHEEVETEPGIFLPRVVPRQFFGDVLKNSWKEVPGDKINADLHISNRLSIVANPYLSNNIHKIAYVTFSGARWTVSDVEVDPDRPKRLTLSLGPIYVEDEEVDDEDET